MINAGGRALALGLMLGAAVMQAQAQVQVQAQPQSQLRPQPQPQPQPQQQPRPQPQPQLRPQAQTNVAADADVPAQRITRSGTVASVAGPAQNFTGRVRVDPLTATNETINTSSVYVTFEPGARSAWHTHPAGQYLIVTAGAGLTQQWGQPVQPLRAGDVVWCPPGVKHWHGAAPTTAMTHIALTGSNAGKNVQWLEQVSDEQYQSH